MDPHEHKIEYSAIYLQDNQRKARVMPNFSAIFDKVSLRGAASQTRTGDPHFTKV